jgi:hypothetical protein
MPQTAKLRAVDDGPQPVDHGQTADGTDASIASRPTRTRPARRSSAIAGWKPSSRSQRRSGSNRAASRRTGFAGCSRCTRCSPPCAPREPCAPANPQRVKISSIMARTLLKTMLAMATSPPGRWPPASQTSRTAADWPTARPMPVCSLAADQINKETVKGLRIAWRQSAPRRPQKRVRCPGAARLSAHLKVGDLRT